MHVLATAGHVDHGKSTLVRVLTGINPDRLREEQQREMTIDLGFAWMTLPSGEPVGIIDVPGHIDFIDNMLAGVGGIDAALVVIASDEGVMPQTREHLAVLSLLNVERGVVALTKTDLAPDPDWVALVTSDVRAVLAGTPLAAAPIVPVSGRKREGIRELIGALTHVLEDAPPRRDISKPRLSVDRSFSLTGFGTVVTGTLVDGAFAVGDEVDVLTERGVRLPARIRGLQTHKQKLERGVPGSRLAINLSGVDVDQVARGSVVASPGALTPTTLLDVRLEILAPAPEASPLMRRPAALRHNTQVKVFSGAAHSLASVWLLETDALEAGEQGLAQLQLARPMAIANEDRFIVRLPSPSITVGGGMIVDVHPAHRYRRKAGRADEPVLTRLAALSAGTPEERLRSALGELRFATPEALMLKAQLTPAQLAEALEPSPDVIVSQEVIGLGVTWRTVQAEAKDILTTFHAAQPLQEGLPRDTLRSRLKLSVSVFNALLRLSPELVDAGEIVRLQSHQVAFTPTQQREVDRFMAMCRAQPWATPSVKDARAALGDSVYEVVLRRQQLVQLGDDVVLLPETYAQAVRDLREYIQRAGQITAAQVRDRFATTRKYALALLEHLDAIGVTKRVGDARVLK